MKTNNNLMIFILLISLLLAFPAPVQATKPVSDLEITAHLTMGLDNSAFGDFTIQSPELFISDSGSAFETYHIDFEDLTIHGEKILMGDKGTIIIKFQAQLSMSFDEAIGTFTIISGTGAYRKLHGVGITNALITYGVIDAIYQGSAHFD